MVPLVPFLAVREFLLTDLLLLLGDKLVHSVQAIVLGLPQLLKRILSILSDNAADGSCNRVFLDGLVSFFPNVILETLALGGQVVDRRLVGLCGLRIVFR